MVEIHVQDAGRAAARQNAVYIPVNMLVHDHRGNPHSGV
jgi:hypothetical protein